MFIPHVLMAGEEQQLSWKTQPCVRSRQEFGFETSDSDPAAFAISVVIKHKISIVNTRNIPYFPFARNLTL